MNNKEPLFNFHLPQDSLKTWEGKMYKHEQLPDGTWQEVYLGDNKVTLGGLQKLCKALYGIDPKIAIKSFEDDIAESASDDFRDNVTKVPNSVDRVMGYNVGYDGSQGTDVIAYMLSQPDKIWLHDVLVGK